MWFVVGIKAKLGNNPFIKCATPFPLILWHPYARHHYFCVMTEKEQKKWHAVLQDCVRHSNNGKSLHRGDTTRMAGVSSCLRALPGNISSRFSHCWHFCRGRVCVCVCVSFTCHLGELWMWDAPGMLGICWVWFSWSWSRLTCFCQWSLASKCFSCLTAERQCASH